MSPYFSALVSRAQLQPDPLPVAQVGYQALEKKQLLQAQLSELLVYECYCTGIFQNPTYVIYLTRLML